MCLGNGPRLVNVRYRDPSSGRRDVGSGGELGGDIGVEPLLGICLTGEALRVFATFLIDIPGPPALPLATISAGNGLAVAVLGSDCFRPTVLDAASPVTSLRHRCSPTGLDHRA